VGELASGVAHEIRNPLTGIRLGIDALTLEPNIAESESNLKIIKKMLKDIGRLENVVSQLLNFTKKRGLKLESADVNKVLGDALLLVEGQARSHGIAIVKDYADDLKPITMDVNQIQQVFLNIVLNALQAMPVGGELYLSTRFVESWKGYKEGAGMPGVVVVCRDTGCGIPERSKDKIFDPFFSTKERGTGLGLSISLKILEDHHGAIKVDSQEGKGTTVTIFLPARG
jgi:signal transduction histidine kinase